MNLLANSPKEFDTSVAEFRIEANRFQGTVSLLETQAARATRLGAGTGAAGVTAGVGVAALGPTAAMAVATTFGTASTGTAISALSGAAATNAALAWLGGGAIAAGGGGMATGGTLLALMSPVGWAVAGVAGLGTGVFLNNRNKNHARKATEDNSRIEAEVRSLQAAKHEIDGLHRRTQEHVTGCNAELAWLRSNHPDPRSQNPLRRRLATVLAWFGFAPPVGYSLFDDAHKKRLAALINHIRSLSELLKLEVEL